MLNEPSNINFVVKCYVTGEDCYCCLLSKMCAPTKFTNDTLLLKKTSFYTRWTMQQAFTYCTFHYVSFPLINQKFNDRLDGSSRKEQ